MPEPLDHDALYHCLGLEPGASQAEIVQAYRRLVHGVHPDTHPSDPGAPARFRLLREAYEALADPRRRADYDRWRMRQQAEPWEEELLAAGTPVAVQDIRIAPSGQMRAADALRVGPVHITLLPECPGGRRAASQPAIPPHATARIALAARLEFGR